MAKEPVSDPGLKPLFDALVSVAALSQAVEYDYGELLDMKGDDPRSWLRGDAPSWVREKIDEWSETYRDWCAAIDKAREAARSPAVAAIMDAGESRLAHRWTTRTIIDLDNLAGVLHPSATGGANGLGFIRAGLPPLPEGFRACVEAVRQRIAELRSVPATAGHEKFIRSSTASKSSSLSASAIEKRAKREGWEIRKAGRQNAYPLSRLQSAWPDRRFTDDS